MAKRATRASAAAERKRHEAENAAAAARMQAKRDAGRDLGELPKPKHAKQRERGRTDPAFFLKWFLPNAFPLAFGDPHLAYIDSLDRISREGGRKAIAMCRGGGKSTITRGMSLRAVLYGIRHFVFNLGANDQKADEAMSFWLMCLLKSPRLGEAFPEVCVPLRKMGRIGQRRPLYQGNEIEMKLAADMIVLPDLPGSCSAGGVLASASLMSASLRGTHYMRADGFVQRPDTVILDDPQTPETAKSGTQTEERERIILGDVLKVSGPNVAIAAIMPCTPIRPGDLAERFLSHDIHPEWEGSRHPMLLSMPDNMELWEEYNRQRIKGFLAGKGIVWATSFYKEHRRAMDAGAVASWAAQFKPGEISAIQSAMNLFFEDASSFAAECQCAPLRQSLDVDQLDRDRLLGRITGLGPSIVPENTTLITAFVDLHRNAHYWAVVAWSGEFGGTVLNYGTWPDQPDVYFALADVRHTLEKKYAGHTMESAVKQGLADVLEYLLGRQWMTPDGRTMEISLALADCGWGQTKNQVFDVCARKSWRGRVLPSKGRGIGPGDKPLSEWRRQPNDIPGPLARCFEWLIPADRKGNPCRSVTFSANHWKTFTSERLLSPIGLGSSLMLHAPGPGRDHRLLVDHLIAEKRIPFTTKNQTGDVWALPPTRPDNHWWDGLVGCAVAASIRGLRLADVAPPDKQSPRKSRRARRRASVLEL